MTLRLCLLCSFLILPFATSFSQSPGKLRQYYDKEFKVGFKYPANWEGTFEKNPVALGTFISVAAVGPTSRMLRGQLFEALVELEVSKDQISEQACDEFTEPVGDGTKKPVKVRLGDHVFYKVSSRITNLNTLEQSETYNTFHEGRCYSVGFAMQRKIVKTQDQNVKAVNDGFATVLRTLYFR